MTFIKIKTGVVANDGTGDDLKESFDTINDNYDESETRLSSLEGSSGDNQLLIKELILTAPQLIAGSSIEIIPSQGTNKKVSILNAYAFINSTINPFNLGVRLGLSYGVGNDFVFILGSLSGAFSSHEIFVIPGVEDGAIGFDISDTPINVNILSVPSTGDPSITVVIAYFVRDFS